MLLGELTQRGHRDLCGLDVTERGGARLAVGDVVGRVLQPRDRRLCPRAVLTSACTACYGLGLFKVTSTRPIGGVTMRSEVHE